MKRSRISLVMPCLNEGDMLIEKLKQLQPLRELRFEIILVDGGSEQFAQEQLQGLTDKLLVSLPGRAKQMNLGAQYATGELLWFLHSDTSLSPEAETALISACDNEVLWGRFDIRLSGHSGVFRLIESMMNWRSRWSGIATGDQGIFVRRSLFEEIGGFPDQALMEDVEISRRLKRFAQPLCLRQRLMTSSRRWEQHGVLYTIVMMWGMRLAYWLGMDPERLAAIYYPCTASKAQS